MIRVDQEFGYPLIGIVKEKNTSCGSAIPPGSSNFLVISFQRSRKVGVNYKADFPSIDPHSERVGSYDHTTFRTHETVLNFPTRLKRQACVIRNHLEAEAFQLEVD